ncbi:MAG: putative replication factor-a protein [Streblomastix strix]|uniref:Putative replication factor-a protein n=1 Tax=Streblomastix strix TaxID=222440 RepID=A0A5J4X686_9EUKA|nr:MAG: putative replication factor-a protein [Streblomastix strix]
MGTLFIKTYQHQLLTVTNSGARVTVKSEIKQYTQRFNLGQGKLLSCDLIDEEGGETKIICFNLVVDKFEPILRKGGIYYIHKGQIKHPTNKKFCRFDNEITLEIDSVIVPINEDSSTSTDQSSSLQNIPKMKWEFVENIASIEQINADSLIDCVGVVIEVGDLQPITIKSKSLSTYKRGITIVDNSLKKIEVIFWGNQATEINNPQPNNSDSIVIVKFGDLLSVKTVKVGEFNGKNLSSNYSYYEINDQQNERCKQLRIWWERTGKNIYNTFEGVRSSASTSVVNVKSKLPRYTFSIVKQQGIGTIEKQPDFFSIIANPVTFQRENMFYNACPNEKCGKKVDGTKCQMCGEVVPTVRYIVNVLLCDHTGSAWVYLFAQRAEDFFKMKAADLSRLEKEKPSEFYKIKNDCLLKPRLWKIKAALDNYQGQNNVKYTCISVDNVLFSRESREMLLNISEYLSDEEKQQNGIIILPPNEAADVVGSITSPQKFDNFNTNL